MCRVLVLLTGLTGLAGCGVTDLKLESTVAAIWVQGAVTAADDGMPIAGAHVRVHGGLLGDALVAETTTDGQGRYTLRFPNKWLCLHWLSAFEDGFRSYVHTGGIQCIEEPQTIDIRLERVP